VLALRPAFNTPAFHGLDSRKTRPAPWSSSHAGTVRIERLTASVRSTWLLSVELIRCRLGIPVSACHLPAPWACRASSIMAVGTSDRTRKHRLPQSVFNPRYHLSVTTDSRARPRPHLTTTLPKRYSRNLPLLPPHQPSGPPSRPRRSGLPTPLLTSLSTTLQTPAIRTLLRRQQFHNLESRAR